MVPFSDSPTTIFSLLSHFLITIPFFTSGILNYLEIIFNEFVCQSDLKIRFVCCLLYYHAYEANCSCKIITSIPVFISILSKLNQLSNAVQFFKMCDSKVLQLYLNMYNKFHWSWHFNEDEYFCLRYFTGLVVKIVWIVSSNQLKSTKRIVTF